jgi:hypothetical protein
VNFFYETINSECYVRLILTHLFDQLTEDEKPYGYFMQHNAMSHTANNSMNVLAEVLGE